VPIENLAIYELTVGIDHKSAAGYGETYLHCVKK